MGGCVVKKSGGKKDESVQLPTEIPRPLESATKKIQDINQEFDEKCWLAIRNSQCQDAPLWRQATGVLTWYDCQKNQHSGSGVLISDTLVLTAASNIFNKKYNRQNFSFQFCRAQDQGNPNKVQHQVQAWLYKKEFAKLCHSDGASQSDYAILKLAKNRQAPIHLREHLVLSVPCLNCMRNQKGMPVNLCKTVQDKGRLKQCQSWETVQAHAYASREDYTISYHAQTDQRDVGCPVLSNQKIVAIHQKSVKREGTGRLITSDMVENILSFCQKLGENFVKVDKTEPCTCNQKAEEAKKQKAMQQAAKQQKELDQEFDEKCWLAIRNSQCQDAPLWRQATGVLTWYDCQKNQHSGSGVLISDTLVLTAASNIFNKKYNRQNFSFQFCRAQDQGNPNKVQHQVQAWLYKKEFAKLCHSDGASQSDYAILKLAKNRQAPIHLREHLVLSVPCLNCMRNQKGMPVNLCKTVQDKGRLKQCQSWETVQAHAYASREDYTISYHAQTDQRDVGCPVLSNQKIVAIHQKSVKREGKGRLITSDMAENILSFCQKLGENFVKVDKTEPCTCNQKAEEAKKQKELQNFLLQCRQSCNKQIPKFIKQRSAQVISLKSLDLSSHDNQKLTPKSIQVFTQLKLVNLQELKLDNNRIADQGVKLISNNPYPNLKVFSIDNNGVSINGLKFIYFNKWSEQVEYRLASVSSNDDGYYLKVDQNIPLIKSLINHKDMSENKVINRLDEKTVQNAVKLFLSTPLQGEDDQKMTQQSIEIEEKYKKSNQPKAPSISALLLYLKKCLGDSLQFTKRANLKTNIASKIIFNGSSNERVSFQMDLNNFKDIRQQHFKNNSSYLRQIQPIFLMHVSTIYGADTSDITLDKILNNPPRVIASDSLSQVLGTNLVPYQKMNPKFKQYFEKFRLCEQEFDPAGDYQFPPPSKAQTQVRGGFPYYQPVIGKRFGIKVMNIFKDNTWLSMDNRKGEYAVAFHGVKNPLTISALQNIMKGREKGQMLRAGSGQACSSYDCINKDEKVGNGIYFSPYFLTSLLGYSNISQGQDYHIVLQCRLKPDSIKITHRTDYWVVNKSEDARPYGILLFTRDQFTELSNLASSKDPVVLHKHIYKDQFTADTWKNKYLPKYMEFQKK